MKLIELLPACRAEGGYKASPSAGTEKGDAWAEVVCSGAGGVVREISGVSQDSRAVLAGDLFFCVPGRDADGAAYAKEAMIRGAAAVAYESTLPEDALETAKGCGVTLVRVASARRSLAEACCRRNGNPSREFALAGVTGTKGKTTATYMMRAMAKGAGVATGLSGTIERLVLDESLSARETTPGPVELQGLFRRMADAGARFVAMEVSSQGLAQERVRGSDFDIGVFTNLYQDHVSPREHSDMDDYLSAKLRLFGMCRSAVVNADSPYCEPVSKAAKAAGASVCSYSVAGAKADVMASRIRPTHDGARVGAAFAVESPWYRGESIISLPGAHNVSNALAALAACGLAGISGDGAMRGLAKAQVRGRAQMVDMGQDFSVMVDYAHNAASLETLLALLRGQGFNGITTVFGCGGDRAKDRRFLMGEASGRLSGFTIVTSDNPRSEPPESIIADIAAGVDRAGGRYACVQDRREAIARAIAEAKPGGLVLIAGKGHETTQQFKDRTIPFDDAAVAAECLADHLRKGLSREANR